MNKNKYALAILKGSIGAFPGGSVIVELLNVTIPDKRLERIEKLLVILSSEKYNVDWEKIEEKNKSSAEFIDILEEVLNQAIKALSNERLDYLASIVKDSLNDEEIEHDKIKRLLSILKQLNDTEVIILQSYDWNKIKNSTFKDKHYKVFKNEFVDGDCSQKEKEQNIIFQQYTDNLINLGLIGLSNKSTTYIQRQNSPSSLFLTPLGAILLKLVGLEEEPIAIGETINSVRAIYLANMNSQINIDKEKNKILREQNNLSQQETKKVEQSARKLINKLRYR